MVQHNPTVKAQLKELKVLKMGMVEKEPAGVVSLRIGELKPNDCARALYVTKRAYMDVSQRNKEIMETLKMTVDEIKELVKISEKMSKEQILEEIKRITLEPEETEELKEDNL